MKISSEILVTLSPVTEVDEGRSSQRIRLIRSKGLRQTEVLRLEVSDLSGGLNVCRDGYDHTCVRGDMKPAEALEARVFLLPDSQ